MAAETSWFDNIMQGLKDYGQPIGTLTGGLASIYGAIAQNNMVEKANARADAQWNLAQQEYNAGKAKEAAATNTVASVYGDVFKKKDDQTATGLAASAYDPASILAPYTNATLMPYRGA